MKLINASFKNFKLLQEIDLSFSVDQSKNLTVIRAANDTGKTTILVA
ncbi:MAG: AAA family ATPase, partial [Bacteroidetes bacterium]|nr:AAA family ATPase [Bacteroidota bacterium]